MAFNPIPKKSGAGWGAKALQAPTVRVTSYFDNWSVHFNIPRHILRDAALPDYPGATIALLLGDGEDAGSVAITAGTDFKLRDPTSSKHPASIGFQTTRLPAEAKLLSTACEFTISKGLLLIRLPLNYPWPRAAKPKIRAA